MRRLQLTWVAVSGAGLFSLIFPFPSVYYFRVTLALSLCLSRSLPTLTRENQKAAAVGKSVLILARPLGGRLLLLLGGGRPLEESLPHPLQTRRAGSRRAAQGERRGVCAEAIQKPPGARLGGSGPRGRPAEPRPPLPTPTARASPRAQPLARGEAGKQRKPLPPPCLSHPTPSSPGLGASSRDRRGG